MPLRYGCTQSTSYGDECLDDLNTGHFDPIEPKFISNINKDA